MHVASFRQALAAADPVLKADSTEKARYGACERPGDILQTLIDPR